MIDLPNTIELNAAQLEAVNEIDRNLQIIACAGSGKTEVITRRIANILKNKPDVKPENIVAFTYTRKAAESMRKRIKCALEGFPEQAVEQMYIGTIHGFCYELLKRSVEEFQDYRILDSVKNYLFLWRYGKKCGIEELNLNTQYPRDIELFETCIGKMMDAYEQRDLWTPAQRTSFEKYRNFLRQHKYLDFPSMIFETLRQINSNPTVMTRLKSIRYLVVDEYQDVDDLQEKLIQYIAKAGANVCVVGDDDQTIYRFRGSNANNMISFAERYPDVHQVWLERNYRCVPAIVDIADHVISHNSNRIPKKLISALPSDKTEICAARYFSEEDQFEEIAEKIKTLHNDGIPYHEIAILVRKGKRIASASTVLASMGIPCKANSAEQFFEGNYFDKFVATLQNLKEPDKAKLFERWEDIVSRAAFREGFKYLRTCLGRDNHHLSEVLCGFCDKISFLAENVEDLEIRKSHLEGMRKILDDFDEIYSDCQFSARIDNLLKFLGTQAAEQYKYHNFGVKDSNEDAVQIMTVHKAKGLEFHTVFLPELIKREFPVLKQGGKKWWSVLGGIFEQNKGKYESELEDERKLFYVAVTRAKRNLYMSYHLTKQPVSCFVAEAAESDYLNINRDDLSYYPQVDIPDFPKNSSPVPTTKSSDWEAERLKQQEYWAAVSFAKEQLYNYYGTACHFFPGAHGDLMQIKSMGPDEILLKASQNNLI